MENVVSEEVYRSSETYSLTLPVDIQSAVVSTLHRWSHGKTGGRPIRVRGVLREDENESPVARWSGLSYDSPLFRPVEPPVCLKWMASGIPWGRAFRGSRAGSRNGGRVVRITGGADVTRLVPGPGDSSAECCVRIQEHTGETFIRQCRGFAPVLRRRV